MATPFVPGLALLMREANPALTPAQVKDAVRSTAADWGRPGADSDYGAGRLDGYAALRAAGAALSSPPAEPKHEVREGSLSGGGAIADYPLYVADTQYPLAATLIVPASGDFDLYLYAPNGTLVAASERVARQEEVSRCGRRLPAPTGSVCTRTLARALTSWTCPAGSATRLQRR
jgi:serine protease AprX